MKKNKEEPDPESLHNVSVDMVIEDLNWLSVPGLEREEIELYIKRVFLLVLKYTGFFEYVSDVEVAVMLAGDGELERLNKNFCYKDGATNVLSFPKYEFDAGEFSELSTQNNEKIFLGDVAISYQRIYNESVEQAKTFKEHFTHILIHAFLHLLGYDHITDVDAEKMEKFEISIMSYMNFKNPYK